MNPLILATFTREITMLEPWLFLCLGLCIGSFLNVCIFRIPDKTFWQNSRSQCRHCHELIPWWWNIPVASFIFLRGKTHCCKQTLSVQYPIVEILTGLLFFSFYLKFPCLQLEPRLSIDIKDALRLTHALIFSSLIIICSFIDLRHKIIPDLISLPMIGLTPLVIYFHPELSWTSGLLGVVIGGGLIYGIAWIYYLLRRQEGIGMGDAKLLAAIGGWLGYQAILPTIFVGSVLGSLVGVGIMLVTKAFSRQLELPFGPFLAIGALAFLAIGPRVLGLLYIVP